MSSQPPYAPPPPPPPVPPAGQPYQPGGAIPLWAPYYGASLGVAFTRFWKKYTDFSGRASRSEFWWWALVAFLVGIVIEIIGLSSGAMGMSMYQSGFTPGASFWIVWVVAAAWGLATIIPTLALTWRRLHDTNLAGPFYFLVLVPFVGGIILLVLTLLPSKPEGARFDRPQA